MKKIVAFSLSLILVLITLSSFNPAKQLLPTKLRVTVIDELGNIAEGVTVTIYKSEADYRGSTNPVKKEVTDKKGRVTFTEVEPISYFIDARKGDKNNDGKGAVTAPLLEGKLNKVNTVIE
ncbi:MAG: carboxypeptidase regulatory-like domain-containing protein [Bacteroidota bacterium]